MEDDNLILLLNTNKSEINTPIQQKREPFVEIVRNDDHTSLVTMNCLNDRSPTRPPNSSKRHFDDIKLVRPSSANSQGSRSKKHETTSFYPAHLISSGNRNSTDNLIQTSIDVTLSSNSSPKEHRQQRLSTTTEEPAFITIVGADDNYERENENPDETQTDNNQRYFTPVNASKPSMPSQIHSTPDVQISRFDKDPTTSKPAFARSQLAKRFAINQAQQRPVPIQSLSNTTNDDLTSANDQQTASSLAATVAASVAVSVAQPFLKLQSEFEQKINTMLDQMQQQQKSNVSGQFVPVTSVQQPPDKSKLLNDSVDTRIKYMEKVQEQQQHVLKQLVDLVQTTKPKSPVSGEHPSKYEFDSPSPPVKTHFLDTLVGQSSSSPVRRNRSKGKHQKHKKKSPSPTMQKRSSRTTNTATREVKIRSPTGFKEQPANGHFNIEPSSPYACSVCDRSRSRSRSRSPAKGLSPDSSYPRPFVPVPRPSSIMSDGFLPSSDTAVQENALKEVYPPFDKYLNKSMPPSPLQPKPSRPTSDHLDLHERIKQIDESKYQLDENYQTLQRRKGGIANVDAIDGESSRIKRLVEQCVKQVTRQVREEVRIKLEEEEKDQQIDEKKTSAQSKRRPLSKTQLAFDRHSTIRTGKQIKPTEESTTSSKPYSEVFMEAVYGRALYQRIKKEGKQPYFKVKNQATQQPKQPKQIEHIPVRDTGLKSSPRTTVAPRPIIQRPPPISTAPTLPPTVYEPEYHMRPDGVVLLGPPQIRDTRTFQPTYVPSAPKLAPEKLPSVNIDSSSKKVRFGHKTESVRFSDDEKDEDEDDGKGIELPGYQVDRVDCHPTYDGPRFPPTIPHDEGYRNREYDTLQTGAIDWLEQELIARFMSQLRNQQTTVPIGQHRDVISARSSTSSSSDDRSIHDRLLDLLGQDGFQLFIDMGQPIEQDLIQALTREVLEERIAQMIGFRSPRESIHVIQPPAPPPRITTPTPPPTTIIDHHHHHHISYDNGVSTPQPTPPHSPPPPPHPPRLATPEITGQEISSDTESITPRSITEHEDLDRPLPPSRHSVNTPDPSGSPSPPSTPRPPPQPPIVIPQPPVIHKQDASTMASIEQPSQPPPVIIQPPRPPSPPPPPPPKPRLPSPVSSTSSSSTSSPSSSSTSSLSISVPYSSTDSPISDHQWFDDRSEGQIDICAQNQPQTELITRRVQRLLDHRCRYSAMTPIGMSFGSPPYSPAGATHTLSIGEVPPHYAASSPYPVDDNEHTTPSNSDESNHSGKSEGQVLTSMQNGQIPSSKPIKVRRSSNGFLGKKPSKK